MTTVRRNIWNLATPQDPWHPITLNYALGVRAMQALPISDSRSWQYQSAIHGTHLAGTPAGAPWNQCQHATWFFLPWHRMYLFHFENILRSLLPAADRDTFALPFWDYSSGAPGRGRHPDRGPGRLRGRRRAGQLGRTRPARRMAIGADDQRPGRLRPAILGLQQRRPRQRAAGGVPGPDIA